jgi:exonuclease III
LSKQTNEQGIVKLSSRGIRMTGNNRHPSVLTMNINGLNVPIKRHGIANWVKKQDPFICWLQKTHLIKTNTCWFRVEGWKKILQANGPHKQASVALLMSDKVNFRLKSVRRDNEVHFILMKRTIEEEISTLNIYIQQTQGNASTLKNSNGPKNTHRC